jgi:hypothetical protein
MPPSSGLRLPQIREPPARISRNAVDSDRGGGQASPRFDPSRLLRPLFPMHRFSSDSALFRFRLSAVLWLLKVPVWLGALGFLGYSVVTHEYQNSKVEIALGGLAFAVFFTIVQTMMCNRCRCPLCIGQPLSRTGAARRSSVPRLFGSYRLRLIASMFLKGYFRCPYCGEPVEMQVRDRRRRREKLPPEDFV